MPLVCLAVAVVAFCAWHLLLVLDQAGRALAIRHRPGDAGRRARGHGRVFTIPAGSARRLGHALIFVAFGVLGVAALWTSPVLLTRSGRLPTAAWAAFALFAWTALPALLFVAYPVDKSWEGPRASPAAGAAFVPMALGLASVLVMAVLAWREANTAVSPMVPMLCLAAAAYAYVRWHLHRLSQQGGGYGKLLGLDCGPEATPPLCQLLAGRALATLVDRPFVALFRRLGARVGLALTAILAALLAVLGQVRTVEGPAFTWFYRLGAGVLLFALLGSLVHTLLLWKETRLLLHRLASSPLAGAFSQVARLKLDWRPRAAPPRREELVILMAAADELDPSGAGYRSWLEQGATGVRLPLLHCPAFFGVWQHLEQYLPGLASGADDPQRRAWTHKARATLALLLAFTIRDLLSRIVSGFAAVHLGLALVLGAHLFHGFQGRTSVLILDGVALALASLLGVHALVQMERDTILARLWNGTPHRSIFNRHWTGL